MNPLLAKLQPYPFERLAQIKQAAQPTEQKSPIDLSIGEPKHEAAAFIKDELIKQLDTMRSYPTTRGGDALRVAIAEWLVTRFKLPASSISPDSHILPVNGTREALFAIAQCVIDHGQKDPIVISPNPFYQIYEGAALLAGAEPYYLNCTKENNYLPDFDQVPEEIWKRCQLVYLCSPGNPTGAVVSEDELVKLLNLADQYDFIIASDECYSEIYFDEDQPPTGLLQAAANAGRDDFRNCLVFHSLSKRSNIPGLRSGFVAGDAALIKKFLLYRTYHGCAMPLPTQYASIKAWQDEEHVEKNRQLYREKFAAVLQILKPVLDVEYPQAGFYLWPEVPTQKNIPEGGTGDIKFASGLLNEQNVTVLPGSFLARNSNGMNPGENRIRIALVASLAETIEAANRIKEFIELSKS